MPPRTELPERLEPLLADFRAGKRRALARAISIVEDEREGFQSVLDALFASVGGAHRIGLTGPPGAGKSTLSARLIRAYRARGEGVGVVAVDPTSPYTGGALLGDRIRMNEAAEDREVFIRSMATRGSLGGLAVTTKEVADVMDAFGFDRVLMETVGVGQSELDIVAAADTTVVVLVPESGDSVQAMKAGLMEIADLFVVNKADRPGAERLTREIELVLHLRLGQAPGQGGGHHGVDMGAVRERWRERAKARAASGQGGTREIGVVGAPEPEGQDTGWQVPVLQTVAESGEGIDPLVDTLERHREWLLASGELERRRAARLEQRVREAVQRALLQRAWREGPGPALLEEARADLLAGRVTPYEVAARIVRAAGL
ncbi:MAG TPA: methylmalonyl Co-A mutase-associated GTPase MeaB [Longimicrobiales bacterium]|nr:methylmalonyl Co-A mutase-associated GTPase MeaB [Longimicrobiales bacterium]